MFAQNIFFVTFLGCISQLKGPRHGKRLYRLLDPGLSSLKSSFAFSAVGNEIGFTIPHLINFKVDPFYPPY